MLTLGKKLQQQDIALQSQDRRLRIRSLQGNIE